MELTELGIALLFLPVWISCQKPWGWQRWGKHLLFIPSCAVHRFTHCMHVEDSTEGEWCRGACRGACKPSVSRGAQALIELSSVAHTPTTAFPVTRGGLRRKPAVYSGTHGLTCHGVHGDMAWGCLVSGGESLCQCSNHPLPAYMGGLTAGTWSGRKLV